MTRIDGVSVAVIPISDVHPPIQKEDYPPNTPFYDWEGSGISPILPTLPLDPEPPPTEPQEPIPTVEYQLRDPNGNILASFDILDEAADYKSWLSIWKITTATTEEEVQ